MPENAREGIDRRTFVKQAGGAIHIVTITDPGDE
jgi:hypothetical protein